MAVNAFELNSRLALDLGVPPFLSSIHQSNPANSSPYILSLSDFTHAFGEGSRARLLDELAILIDALRAVGHSPAVLLIGGSFIDKSRQPRDLDGLCLYESNNVPHSASAALLKDAKRRGIDLRVFPLDGNPILVLKMVSFFTLLYAQTKETSMPPRGSLIIDCTR